MAAAWLQASGRVQTRADLGDEGEWRVVVVV